MLEATSHSALHKQRASFSCTSISLLNIQVTEKRAHHRLQRNHLLMQTLLLLLFFFFFKCMWCHGDNHTMQRLQSGCASELPSLPDISFALQLCLFGCALDLDYCTPSSNLTECKGHQQQNVHAEKETPPVTPGTHFCGAISAIRLLMPEPMRQEYRHAGDSVSHNVTELQIGGCMKITLIFILLKTFGGERTCPRVCFRNTYSTLAVHPEGLIQGWAAFKHL